MNERLNIETEARLLGAALVAKQTRVVLAESCTAGLAAATLAGVAGISNYFCGSAVTYRDATKSAWLDIDAALIQRHQAVSEQVAKAMATGVLQRTDEAQLAASITGDLGPGAAAATDGIVFVACARRNGDRIELVSCERIELIEKERVARQSEAAARLLRALRLAMEDDAVRQSNPNPNREE